jgi:hypothetical protein
MEENCGEGQGLSGAVEPRGGGGKYTETLTNIRVCTLLWH